MDAFETRTRGMIQLPVDTPISTGVLALDVLTILAKHHQLLCRFFPSTAGIFVLVFISCCGLSHFSGILEMEFLVHGAYFFLCKA